MSCLGTWLNRLGRFSHSMSYSFAILLNLDFWYLGFRELQWQCLWHGSLNAFYLFWVIICFCTLWTPKVAQYRHLEKEKNGLKMENITFMLLYGMYWLFKLSALWLNTIEWRNQCITYSQWFTLWYLFSNSFSGFLCLCFSLGAKSFYGFCLHLECSSLL